MSTMCMIIEQVKKKMSNLEMQGVSVGKSMTSTSRWIPGNTLARWKGRRLRFLSSMVFAQLPCRFLMSIPLQGRRAMKETRPSRVVKQLQTIHFSVNDGESTNSKSIDRLLEKIECVLRVKAQTLA